MPTSPRGAPPAPVGKGWGSRHPWSRPLTAPWPVVQTFSAVAVLLAVAITLVVTSRVVALVRTVAADEASAS